MEEEEKRIEKAEKEKDKKDEKWPSGKEKIPTTSSKENVSNEYSSQLKIFDRCSVDQTDTSVTDACKEISDVDETPGKDLNKEKRSPNQKCAKR